MTGQIPSAERIHRDSMWRQPIVLATHEYFPTRGGAGVYVHELASAAARQGYNVRVVAPGHRRWRGLDPGFKLEALASGRLAGGWWHSLATAGYLVANRGTLRHETLHICQQGPLRVMMILGLLGLVKPKRLIVTLHGSELLQLSGSRLGGRWLFQRLLDKAERIAVLSRWVHHELVRRFPTVATKAVIAPRAPRAGWSPRRARSDGAESCITVLTVGRIHPRKGQHTMLEALRRLDDDRSQRLRYVMVGPVISRAYARSLRHLASTGGIDVVFAGEVDDEALADYFADADIFAMTSALQSRSVEGFGLAILEASASGLPILAHRTGGIEDTVRHGVTGLLVEPGDLEELVAALTRLLDDPGLRAELGAGGREWVKRFSWDQCARVIYDVAGANAAMRSARHSTDSSF